MGEAKARRADGASMLYHHTSVLRTNLIWMSGVVDLEGQSKGAIHPQLGELRTDGRIRRTMKDFPALVWLTTKIEVPNCLRKTDLVFLDEKSGEKKAQIELTDDLANAISLTRVALGFRASEIPATPWKDHYGYRTGEGQELNATAREVGDNPDDWYVSDAPLDAAKISEFRHEVKRRASSAMVKHEGYVKDIHRMVALCRAEPGVHIPPSWVSEKNLNEYFKIVRGLSNTE